MEIKGVVNLSLVDWDGNVCSVFFLPNCNFRCPFCHNYVLVLYPEREKTLPFEQVEAQLKKQRRWIDGVCITGGEPTLHSDLPNLCLKLKEMGLRVKVDTNGTNPRMIRELVDKKLVDYVAVDVKAPLTLKKYSKAIGVDAEKLLEKVKETVRTLPTTKVDYEFRTTVVPTLHTEKDVVELCRDIKGCKKYVLQRFDTSLGKKTLDPKFGKLNPFTEEEIEIFLKAAQKILPNVKIR